jgi:hypothetical protein
MVAAPDAPRRFTALWRAVRDANGQGLAYLYGRETKADARQAKVKTPQPFRDSQSGWRHLHCALRRGSLSSRKRCAQSSEAFRTRTGLYGHSNQSLFGGENSAGKEFGQRPEGHFWRHPPIPGDGDRLIPRRRGQSHGKSKTIPTAPGNRNCAGLRGGPGRTRTCNQAVMSA